MLQVQDAASRKVCQELHGPRVLMRAREAEREEGVLFLSSAWSRLRPRYGGPGAGHSPGPSRCHLLIFIVSSLLSPYTTPLHFQGPKITLGPQVSSTKHSPVSSALFLCESSAPLPPLPSFGVDMPSSGEGLLGVVQCMQTAQWCPVFRREQISRRMK